MMFERSGCYCQTELASGIWVTVQACFRLPLAHQISLDVSHNSKSFGVSISQFVSLVHQISLDVSHNSTISGFVIFKIVSLVTVFLFLFCRLIDLLQIVAGQFEKMAATILI